MDTFGYCVTIGVLACSAIIWIVCSIRLSRSRNKAEALLSAGIAYESDGNYSAAVAVYCEALINAAEAPDTEGRIIPRLTAIYQRHLPAHECQRAQVLLHDLMKLTHAYQKLLSNRMENDNIKRCEENQALKWDVLQRLPREVGETSKKTASLEGSADADPISAS